MAELNDALQNELWTVFNGGSMPSEIRMNYKHYCAMMLESEFAENVELPVADKPLTYQTIPIVFDSWIKTFKIGSVPRGTE